jgi:CIC family chloride channel protein
VVVLGEKKTVIPPKPMPRKLMETKVREVMNKRPRTVSPETSIDGLLERMMGQLETCFPVVDKNHKLLGIVTESDILQIVRLSIPQMAVGSVLKEVFKSSASTVAEIMTERPISVTPEMKVSEVLNLMVAHKLRRLPVVEKDRLVGLVSLRGIIELYRVMR